jgi:3-hydroxyacyl-CoA dehydrogenase
MLLPLPRCRYGKIMKKIAIVGRGIIGSSWAIVFARAGLNVAIWDRSGHGSAAILGPIIKAYGALEGTALSSGIELEKYLSSETDLGAVLGDADYVQESVSEEPALKADVLKMVSELTPPGTVIASSTSGILPSVLAQDVVRKERFVVVHPLTPPHVLPITEIVSSKFTSPEILAATEELLNAVGQKTIRVRNEVRGFVLNRILAAMMNEIFHLIADGTLDPDDADLALTEGFGLRWACVGPLAAMDLNANGGIEEYLSRYGYIYEAVAVERGSRSPLNEQLIEKLGTAMRAMYPPDTAAERKVQRDRAIAKVVTEKASWGR